MAMTRDRFQASVKFMRIACPLALFAAIALGARAWSQEHYGLVAINAFIAGVNSMLTWIQWRWFKI
jgi:hypothetical protein